jgi:hypothetical protein
MQDCCWNSLVRKILSTMSAVAIEVKVFRKLKFEEHVLLMVLYGVVLDPMITVVTFAHLQ